MMHRKNLTKFIHESSHRHDSWRVFSDFVEMSAISLSNAVDFAQREAREARYMEIIGRYDKEEVYRFTKMLAELVMALEASPGDVLGETFMALEAHIMSGWEARLRSDNSAGAEREIERVAAPAESAIPIVALSAVIGEQFNLFKLEAE